MTDTAKQQLGDTKLGIKDKSSCSSEQSEDNTSDRSIKELSRRPSTPRVPSPTKPVSSPASSASVAKPPVKEENRISLNELRRPAFVEHQARFNDNLQIKKPIILNGKEKKNGISAIEATEKSWMKIVKISKEEQDELERYMRTNSFSCFSFLTHLSCLVNQDNPTISLLTMAPSWRKQKPLLQI